MRISKRTAAGMVFGGATLVTSGFLTIRRYMGYRQLKSELDSIPWDVPKKYTSWRLFFNSNPK